MIRADVIFLISEDPSGHGVFDTRTYTEKMVYCNVGSVTMSEWYRAHEQGLEPSVVFTLADYADYNGERLARWGDRLLKIIRTYVNGMAIELVCEESEVYASTAITDN